MKGTIVCDIPVVRNHNLKRFLGDFMLTKSKHYKVELEEGEYKTPYTAYESIRYAIKRHKYPIKISIRKGVIYLTRTGM